MGYIAEFRQSLSVHHFVTVYCTICLRIVQTCGVEDVVGTIRPRADVYISKTHYKWTVIMPLLLPS